MNEHWNRWIAASLGTFFESKKGGLKFVFEGQHNLENTDFIEMRWTGPEWLQPSKNQYVGEVVVNILVKAIKSDTDTHKIYRMVGIVEKAFESCIPIKKYGNNPIVDDREVIIGYLILTPDGGKDIRTEHFGVVSPSVPLIQSTVEGTYRTYLIAEPIVELPEE